MARFQIACARTVVACVAALAIACDLGNVHRANRAPVAVGDEISGAENQTLTIDALANDFDLDGDAIALVSCGEPSLGTLTQQVTGRLIYTPFADINGEDAFSCIVQDTHGAASTAAVVIRIAAVGLDFYVAPGGSDAASGTREAPFATLENARDALRSLRTTQALPEGGAVVWLRGGFYSRTASFTLGALDSGTVSSPMKYRAYPGETVRLVGGTQVQGNAWTPVDESFPIWPRLDPTAQGHVYVVDLPTLGITDYGTLRRRGAGRAGTTAALELALDGQILPLARWPDDGVSDPPASTLGDTMTLFGDATPAVSGVYDRQGEQDGVPAYVRRDLVDGLQYYLYRRTWDYLGTTYTAWFLTTDTTGYPTSTHPWWYRYNAELGDLAAANGASGAPTTRDPARIDNGFVSIAGAIDTTTFRYAGERAARWLTATDPWVYGYWKYYWADEHLPLAAIDTAAHTMTTGAAHNYGLDAGQPYLVENLPEEITQPGEWYLDRATGLLYLYAPVDLANAEVLATMIEQPVVHLQSAEAIELHDLTIELGRVELVRIENGAHNRIVGCTVRNGGTHGITVSGVDNGVDRSELYGLGDSGVLLVGGNRYTLEAAGNFVTSSHIHDYGRFTRTYTPAVKVEGVGNLVRHNRIHDAPHNGVLFSGNEHQIEYNDISHVLEWTGDAGAIYTGRDWGYRGNRIRHNFIHHLTSRFGRDDVHGVYLDDAASGIEVSGNVLYAIDGIALVNGGGRDNIMVNNVVAKCGWATFTDRRGTTTNNIPGDSWNLLEKIQRYHHTVPPWSTAYPALAAIPDDFDLLDGWKDPGGTVFSRNLGWQNGGWMREGTWGGTGGFTYYAEIDGNIEDVDPHFADEANLDLSLLADSPAYTIPDFVPIPFELIGITGPP